MAIFQKFQTNKLLSEISTFGVGGPAKWYVEVQTVDELKEVIKHCFQHKLPYFILGKGSNLVFDDRGFDGLVIGNRIQFCQIEDTKVSVGAGYSYSLLGSQTARKQLSGLEFASGIPGSVGGAVYMNAGAGKAQTADCLQDVLFIDEKGEECLLKKEELKFSYRFSSFQKMRGAIAAATFELKSSPEARQSQLSLIKYRTSTQPYQDKSAGCMFRNPGISSAGALIEKCGLKGFSMGGAGVSKMHANFIINQKDATAEDVRNLSQHVRKLVQEQTGIELEFEVRFIPYHQGESLV